MPRLQRSVHQVTIEDRADTGTIAEQFLNDMYSNVHRREAIYHKSLVSMTATAVMAGLGAEGYRFAVRAVGTSSPPPALDRRKTCSRDDRVAG